MMDSLTLRELNVRDEGAFLFGARRCSVEDLKWYSFIWNWEMPYSLYLKELADHKAGKNLPEGRVPDTMLYAFLEHQIIGRVNIRHILNDQLMKRGGHIGYWIHPRYRGLGYGCEMVRQALPYCRQLGLEKILITCSKDNAPSIRIIEKLGGVMENEIWDEEEGQTVRRYWVKL